MKIIQREPCPRRRELGPEYAATKRRKHFDVDGVRRVKARRSGHPLSYPGSLRLELQEVIHDRRGVDDDHIESRISRRISEGGRLERVPGRLLIRAVSSSMVSVSASRSAMRSR